MILIEYFSIFLSLFLLMLLAYRGYSVLLLAPVLALLAVALSGNVAGLLPTYTQVFMQAVGTYIAQFFPVFLLGAVFGRLMQQSGCAQAIAQGVTHIIGPKHAILAVVLACALLTYGGVSLFVVAFAVYPVGALLFRQGQVPQALLPGAIALGAFTFTMTALPGTPSIQNAIPMPYFKTDAYAAPGLGILASVMMFALGLWWLNRKARQLAHSQPDSVSGLAHRSEQHHDAKQSTPIPIGLALLPILTVMVCNFVLSQWLLPRWVSSAQFQTLSGPSAQTQIGLWAIIVSLVLAIVVLLALHGRRIAHVQATLNEGAGASLLPMLNTATEVGYGTVIATLAGFALIKNAVLAISPDNALLTQALVVNVLAGITGSASGGMSIALQAMGGDVLSQALSQGISPELLHRITAMASGCMDTLPHNGAVITLLAICGQTHRAAYGAIAMNTIVFPMLALLMVLVLGSAWGGF